MPRKPTVEVTKTGQRFNVPLFVRVDDVTGTLIPAENEHVADYSFQLTLEYPLYEEELQLKKSCQFQDEYGYRFDYEKFLEERVRRCLVKWDLQDRIPDLTDKLLRTRNLLTDESLELWKTLPPLIRKQIADTITTYIGGP